MNDQELVTLFKEPKSMCILGSADVGKSNLAHDFIKRLDRLTTFNLYTYGFRSMPSDVKAVQIYSIQELEQIKNSIIFLDEFETLLDLENRKNKASVERTLRLIHHNNNCVVFMGTPDNFKKFLAAKIEVIFFKRSVLADYINGSKIKNILMAYQGQYKGSAMLDLKDDEVLYFDGVHYNFFKVAYHIVHDLKQLNKPIVQLKNKVSHNVSDNISEIVDGELL